MEVYKNEELKQFQELCNWVEVNIFNYDSSYKKLNKTSTLILKGLQRGQYVANNNCKRNGYYPLNVVLMAFKANKIKIQNSIKNKYFDSETNKMLYICNIVKKDIDDVYERYLKVQNLNKEKED